MHKNTTTYESAQLSQMLRLTRGVRYKVQCRMRWEDDQESPTMPIVNVGLYHEETNTCYGPIDQYLKNPISATIAVCAVRHASFGFSPNPPLSSGFANRMRRILNLALSRVAYEHIRTHR
jgi:hypothetical protein